MPCQVDVFALHVTGQLDDWPEKNQRRSAWLPVEHAAEIVAEPGVRQILADFRKRHQPARARRAAG